MAYKKNNLIISSELYLDPDTRVLYNTRTGKNQKIGKQMAVIVEFLVNNPNMALASEQFDKELNQRVSIRDDRILDDIALKQQINRFKRTLVSISDNDDVRRLITSSDSKWIYHQPKEVLEFRPRLNPDYYFSTEKKYLEPNLPRLIGQYEASRDELVNTVVNSFTINDEKILFLTGEAGVGKSETAISIGRKLAQSFKVARLIYENSLYDTVMELYPELNGSNEQTSFEKKFSALIQAYDGHYLIIDNFYDPARTFIEMVQDHVFRRLLSSNAKILFVTRYQNTGFYTSYEVPPLHVEEQVRVMRGDGLEMYTDEDLAHLCELVGGNTLLCDLIGKLLRNPYNRSSYTGIEKLLTTNSLSSSSLNVFSEKDREYYENPIYQHLRNLCGDIAITEEEAYVLNAASFLPLDGMRMSAFSSFCGCDENTLSSLHSKGLIKLNDSGDVLLHKLYSLYYRDPSCSSEIRNSDIRPFLQSLCDWYADGDLSDHRLTSSICSVLNNVYITETDMSYKAYLGIYYACYLALFGKYREAYAVEEQSLKAAEKLDLKSQSMLYKDIAISAGRLSIPGQAVEYLEKAVSLVEKQEDRTALLSAMNSLAYAYGKAGDFEKQRTIAEEALALCDPGKYVRNQARILNNLADCEYHLALYEDAKGHIEEAMDLYRSMKGIMEIWPVQAMRLYANILFSLGDRKKAFETAQSALTYAKKALNKDHLEIVRLYSCLGDLSEPEEAKKYYMQVIELSLWNPMAAGRLEFCRNDDRYYITYLSENRTLFRLETTRKEFIRYEPLRDEKLFARVIDSSLEENKGESVNE